jgi:non-specific serine/threonine protein kinase
LAHSNIVTVYELGEDEGRVFIAMELIEGQSLRALIGERPLPVDRALDIAIQLAEALKKAHSHDVLHRDVKPDNVMVDSEGRAKLLDFSL